MIRLRVPTLLVCLVLTPLRLSTAQRADTVIFTHADTLRGSITPQRAWWDVTFYDLHVAVDLSDSTLRGYNGITYRVVKPARELQIDLMTPLQIDSVTQGGHRLVYRRDGNAIFVTPVAPQPLGRTRTVTVYYRGRPWSSRTQGCMWTRDSVGHPWITTECQGGGASLWWPTKDTQADEPDSQRIAVTVPDSLMDISNGRLRSTTRRRDGTTTYEWFVQDPINNYGVTMNIGVYTHFQDHYAGKQGVLTMDFWPLVYHLDDARRQFQQARSMLSCFEEWFGPYPWYRDGYKLVETPYLGEENQSAIAYGNHYHNGYLGRDLSGTGWGLRWDYIIVHESAHEWFGNSITTQDIADMWVHESFAMYAEGLYTACRFGEAAGATYLIGLRKRVQNRRPIISHYGVNEEGPQDMYYKGANMLHTIRQIVHNDTTWRRIFLGLNKTFRHQIVTGEQVQHYLSAQAGIDLTPVFRQYLTTTRIPVLEYTLVDSTLSYRWTNVVPGFDMPVRVLVAPRHYDILHPTEQWQTVTVRLEQPDEFHVDENYYVDVKRSR